MQSFTQLLVFLLLTATTFSLPLTPRANLETTRCNPTLTPFDPDALHAAISEFCSSIRGNAFTPGGVQRGEYAIGKEKVFFEAEAIGCGFVVDGNCERLLGKSVDECAGHTGEVTETPVCGRWAVGFVVQKPCFSGGRCA